MAQPAAWMGLPTFSVTNILQVTCSSFQKLFPLCDSIILNVSSFGNLNWYLLARTLLSRLLLHFDLRTGLYYLYVQQYFVVCTLSRFWCLCPFLVLKKDENLQIKEYVVTEFGQCGRSLENARVSFPLPDRWSSTLDIHFWQNESVLQILWIGVDAPI